MKYPLKNYFYFFLLNAVLFNGKIYQKQKEPDHYQSLLRLQNKFTKISLFVIHYLTKFDDVIWSGFKWFQKTHLQLYVSQFITSKIIPLPFVLLNLENAGEKGKKYKNMNISRRKRAFQMKWKLYFKVVEGLSFGEKTKKLIKKSWWKELWKSWVYETNFGSAFLVKCIYVSTFWCMKFYCEN